MSPVREAGTSASQAARAADSVDAQKPRVVSGRVIRTRNGRLSLRVHGRAVAVTVALLVALTTVMGITLTTGDFELSVAEVLQALAGKGSGAPTSSSTPFACHDC